MSKKRGGGSYFEDDDDFVENESVAESSELSENDVEQDDEEQDEEEMEEDQDDVDVDVEEQFSDSDEEANEQKGGRDDDIDDDGGDNDGDKEKSTNGKKIKKIPQKIIATDDDDDDEDGDGENYLKKFDSSINQNYIVNFHPECALQNYDEIMAMTKVVRDKNGIIVDDLHKTIPYLTKYEKARILGQRAKQINSGATPFVKVPENVIDGYLIAQLELEQKRIPFIIRRPLPNGGSEYWSLKDLENISF
jgi:DNA-directed RNA polymerases I, II, and III subunit RPABC2